jgi:hypothetical protein
MGTKRTQATITFTPDEDGPGIAITILYGTAGDATEQFDLTNPAHMCAAEVAHNLEIAYGGERIGSLQ